MNGREVCAVFLVLAVFVAGMYVGIWQLWQSTNDNPCETWTHRITGNVIAGNRTITCFHGYPSVAP